MLAPPEGAQRGVASVAFPTAAALLLASVVLGLVFRAEPLPGHGRAAEAA